MKLVFYNQMLLDVKNGVSDRQMQQMKLFTLLDVKNYISSVWGIESDRLELRLCLSFQTSIMQAQNLFNLQCHVNKLLDEMEGDDSEKEEETIFQ